MITTAINQEIESNTSLGFVFNNVNLSVNYSSIIKTSCSGNLCDRQRVNDWLGVKGCGCYGMSPNSSSLVIQHALSMTPSQNRQMNMLEFSSLKFSELYLNVEIPGYGTGIKINSPTSSSVDNQAMTFYQQTTKVGSIMINTSSTSYNTTSDYRLKENREDISDAIERVKELKPIKFNWIKEPGESKVDGFYAHELAEVVPEAVTGEKDALDWEGNPEYQAIDQAKIVPLLAAALQQAIDKIEALEVRIQILENK